MRGIADANLENKERKTVIIGGRYNSQAKKQFASPVAQSKCKIQAGMLMSSQEKKKKCVNEVRSGQ